VTSRTITIRFLLLPVLVEVDETGRHDVAGCVDDAHAGDRRLGHGRDLPAPNPDVAHRVEPRLGIEDASVRDH
jgi:hypothetical protein